MNNLNSIEKHTEIAAEVSKSLNTPVVTAIQKNKVSLFDKVEDMDFNDLYKYEPKLHEQSQIFVIIRDNGDRYSKIFLSKDYDLIKKEFMLDNETLSNNPNYDMMVLMNIQREIEISKEISDDVKSETIKEIENFWNLFNKEHPSIFANF